MFVCIFIYDVKYEYERILFFLARIKTKKLTRGIFFLFHFMKNCWVVAVIMIYSIFVVWFNSFIFFDMIFFLLILVWCRSFVLSFSHSLSLSFCTDSVFGFVHLFVYMCWFYFYICMDCWCGFINRNQFLLYVCVCVCLVFVCVYWYLSTSKHIEWWWWWWW